MAGKGDQARGGNSAAASPVLVEQRGGLVVLTLNRPDKLNSFNEAQHRALKAAIDSAATSETCRAIILTGAGRGFCAGQDLSDRVRPEGGAAPDLGETLEKFYNPLIRTIRAMPKPVIAAVNGVAAGAGANLALACDLVLAAKSAKFVQAFAKIGLIRIPAAPGCSRALWEKRAPRR